MGRRTRRLSPPRDAELEALEHLEVIRWRRAGLDLVAIRRNGLPGGRRHQPVGGAARPEAHGCRCLAERQTSGSAIKRCVTRLRVVVPAPFTVAESFAVRGRPASGVYRDGASESVGALASARQTHAPKTFGIARRLVRSGSQREGEQTETRRKWRVFWFHGSAALDSMRPFGKRFGKRSREGTGGARRVHKFCRAGRFGRFAVGLSK